MVLGCLLFAVVRSNASLAGLQAVVVPLLFCGGDECVSKESAEVLVVGAAAAFYRRGRAILVKNRQSRWEFDPTKGYAGQDILMYVQLACSTPLSPRFTFAGSSCSLLFLLLMFDLSSGALPLAFNFLLVCDHDWLFCPGFHSGFLLNDYDYYCGSGSFGVLPPPLLLLTICSGASLSVTETLTFPFARGLFQLFCSSFHSSILPNDKDCDDCHWLVFLSLFCYHLRIPCVLLCCLPLRLCMRLNPRTMPLPAIYPLRPAQLASTLRSERCTDFAYLWMQTLLLLSRCWYSPGSGSLSRVSMRSLPCDPTPAHDNGLTSVLSLCPNRDLLPWTTTLPWLQRHNLGHNNLLSLVIMPSLTPSKGAMRWCGRPGLDGRSVWSQT